MPKTDACYIFGYGSEQVSGDPTLDLRLAPVKIISYESCLKELGPSNAPERNSGMFCAVGVNPGADACSVNVIVICFLLKNKTCFENGVYFGKFVFFSYFREIVDPVYFAFIMEY